MRDLTPFGRVALLAFAALLLAMPWIASGYVLSITIICLYLAYMGQAWNLMLGFAGLLSIGHALFVGLGAYTAAYLYVKGLSVDFDFASIGLEWGKVQFVIADSVPPAIGVIASVAIAAVMGALIGYLGFRFAISGVYFALLTIAFSEFVRILIDHAKFVGGTEGFFLPVTQASRRGVDLLNLRGYTEMYYYLILALAAGAFLLCRALLNGRVGYYWRAVRDNPEAAEAVGVHIFRYRMYAVMLSSAMAGVAGVFYAFYYNNLFPEQVLGIERSIEVTLAPIVGGVGTLFGPIFGAFLLTPMGELLTSLVNALQAGPLLGPGVNVVTARYVLIAVAVLCVALSLLRRRRGLWPVWVAGAAALLLCIPGVLEWLKANPILDKRVKVDGVKLMFWGLAVALIVLLKPTGLWPWVCKALRFVKPAGEQSSPKQRG
jgi:branched-chain amino acid transport system permease protein